MEREAMSISRSASSCLASLPADTAEILAENTEFEIAGSSAAMRRLRLQVRRIGPHFRSVLVSGESGTGKELVARTLHRIGHGAGAPFVVCDAAAFEEALGECKVGVADVIGRMMKNHRRGTLFLNGINEMPLETQERLVRVLRQHEAAQSRVDAPLKIDLRIVASTAEDLKILMSAGRFLQELYQRLATVEVTLPPLRERMEDLPELARCFLRRFALLYGKGVHEIADEVMEQMQRSVWPGNVRELESALRNGVLQSEGEVLETRHLPVLEEGEGLKNPVTSVCDSLRLEDVVHRHVRRVLKDCRGNKLRAAETLGISRSTLYRMLDAGASLDALR
jgi:DNA-binding NtrC family response regulator